MAVDRNIEACLQREPEARIEFGVVPGSESASSCPKNIV